MCVCECVCVCGHVVGVGVRVWICDLMVVQAIDVHPNVAFKAKRKWAAMNGGMTSQYKGE